jgi:biopolymer transport protein ExbB/TolQ
MPIVEKRTGSLQALANIATLLGLLGTVIGLILAFASLKTVAPDQRQEALGVNIALAMNTTAFGLIVAIPAIAAYTFLAGITKKISNEIDLYSLKLENLLIARLKGNISEEAAEK